MTHRQTEKVERLRRIIELRKQFNIRWGDACVYIQDKDIVVHWYHPKYPDLFGEFHKKSTPIKNIGKFVKQQERKLYNEFKNRNTENYHLKV